MPLMISRLMLSLKKASKVGENGWTTDALARTHPRTITQIAFREPLDGPQDSGGTISDEVELSDFSDERVRRRGDGSLRDNRYRAGFMFCPGETRSGSEPATVVPHSSHKADEGPGAMASR